MILFGRNLFLTVLPSGERISHPDPQYILDLLGEQFSRRTEVVSYSAVKSLLGDAGWFFHQLQERFVLPQVRPVLSHGPVDVVLAMDHDFHGLPWEMVFDRELFPGAYDGLRSVRRIVPESMGRSDVPTPRGDLRVLVVRRSQRTNVALEAAVPPVMLDAAYRRCFSDVSVVEDPSIMELHLAILRARPDVIHICSAVAESYSAGGAVLEFASRGLDVAQDSVRSVSAGLLAESLGSTNEDREIPPVVILDVVPPRGDTETVRQLMLRNIFAAQLFGSNQCSAVIATGFFHQYEANVVYDNMIRDLAQNGSFGEAVRRIHAEHGAKGFMEVGARQIGGPATAFFSRTPDFRTP